MVWRLIVVVTFVAASCVVSGARQAGQTKPTGAEEEVRRLERQWLDAYEQNDPVAMDRIVADDFTITFPSGRVQTKPELMATIKSPRRAGQPRQRFYTDGVQSRAYGDTVILVGRVTAEYERDGKPFKETSRYTDTYVRRGGRWQVVASHLSNVGESK